MGFGLKPGELKALEREGLLLLGARCALRCEPWIPPGSKQLFAANLAFLVAAASGLPEEGKDVRKRERALNDKGALATYRRDEALGSSMGYAMTTLATAVEATALADRMAVRKLIMDAAKYCGSLFSSWAHAGRAGVPHDVVFDITWNAIRADIAPIGASVEALRDVSALRRLQPLWPGRPPRWATPSADK